ncbi:class I SAM-dependent methyltransferase [Phytopseudomonas daroniae]|uniref:class I SAM-dependent methyltransferase n=1 Tax=Phytopseudomonas daroniae TaxID=2487519 RepID=UPI001FC9BC50|nr:class I SAM-dependent methyltransferase [Pseudomonas daroniae]
MDVAYPAHFNKEIQPVWLASVANFLGSVAPDIQMPYSYCELGCGVGIDLLVAAATNPKGKFVGVDFNEEHLRLARNAANVLELKNVRFIQADFESFARQNNMLFDFVVLHGVWSWVAPKYQKSVLQIVAKSLAPNGIFYLHYMCHPGATHLISAQKLINDLSHCLVSGSEQSVQAGLDLLSALDEVGVFADQPKLKAHLQVLRKKNAAYLAHDFLTDYWRPQHSVDVHKLVAQAGVSYLGSADPYENQDALSIPGGVQPLLTTLPSPAMQEMVKDLARGQHQRKDIYQRGARSLSPQEHLEHLDCIRFQLLPAAPRSGGVRFSTPIGVIEGPAAVFDPLLQVLAKGAASFSELRQQPAFTGEPGILLQALQMLMWRGNVHPLRPEQQEAPCTDNLKQWLCANNIDLDLVPECGTAFTERGRAWHGG